MEKLRGLKIITRYSKFVTFLSFFFSLGLSESSLRVVRECFGLNDSGRDRVVKVVGSVFPIIRENNSIFVIISTSFKKVDGKNK